MSDMSMTTNYDNVRPQLSWVCDAMIPGDAELGMPSASEVDVLNTLLPKALMARPDLAPEFFAVVSSFPAMAPENPVATLNAVPEEQMDVVGRFIAGAYFTSPQVSSALRFPGFQAIYENVDYDEIMELIEPVIERGQHYLDVT